MEIVLITFPKKKKHRTIRSTKKNTKKRNQQKQYVEQHNRIKYTQNNTIEKNTQNNAIEKDYIQKDNSLTRKSSVCAPYFRGIPWHLPYKLRRKARKNLGQASRRMPFGTMKAEYTEQNIDNKKKINMTINLKITINIDV